MRVTDAYGQQAGRARGYCFPAADASGTLDAEARQRVTDAHAEYERALTERWRAPNAA